MPGQMRFCRMCGYRLGEGVAEYAETIRFQEPPGPGRQPATAQKEQDAADAGNPSGAMMGQPGQMPGQMPVRMAGPAYDLNATAQPGGLPTARVQGAGVAGGAQGAGHRRWAPWLIWPILGITITVASAGGYLMGEGPFQSPEVKLGQEISGPEMGAEFEGSSLGAGDFTDDYGGASFDYVTPGSAADKAGLVGGDIIKSFDGHAVENAEQLGELLGHTPAGRTVEVVFVRDGVARTIRLTTVSEDENGRLGESFEERGEGRGFIGEGTELERVRVPGMNIYGVQLGEIDRNNPADIAGLKNGDIVVEFDGIPVRTRREFESRIRRAAPGSTVKTVVVRNGARLEVPIRIGRED